MSDLHDANVHYRDSVQAKEPPAVRQARSRLTLAATNWEQLLIVHYACEAFENTIDQPGEVYNISVKDLSSSAVYSFNAQINGSENSSLDGFSQFVDECRTKYWLHWNMRDTTYGFEAIERRHRHLGGKPSRVPVKNRIDLAAILYGLFGANYVADPKLPHLVRLNSISDRGLLDGEVEARAGKQRKYGAVAKSTLRKLEVLEEILRRTVENRLCLEKETDNHKVQRTTPRKGVSLQDAAERIVPDDRLEQGRQCKRWQNSRDPKLPKPIGKAPEHSQRNLYDPGDLLAFLRKVEGGRVDKDFGLIAYFRKVSRESRPH